MRSTLRGIASLGLCAGLLLAASTAAAEPAAAPTQSEAPQLPPTSADDRPHGFLLDANGGIPVASEGKSQVAFDLTTGYAGRAFGAQIHYSTYAYGLQTADNITDTERTRVLLQLRYLTGDPTAKTRVEIRGEAESTQYLTSYTAGTNGPNFSNATETSAMFRLSALFGVRFVPEASTRAFFLAGAGRQQEEFSRSNVANGGSNGSNLTFNSTSSDSTRLVLRAGAWRSIAHGLVSVRPEAEASRFSLERTTIGYDSKDPFAGGLVPEPVTFTQIDAKARLFVHAELLSFFGLAPVAFAGVDYFSLSGAGNSTSGLKPIFGAGVANAIPVDY